MMKPPTMTPMSMTMPMSVGTPMPSMGMGGMKAAPSMGAMPPKMGHSVQLNSIFKRAEHGDLNAKLHELENNPALRQAYALAGSAGMGTIGAGIGGVLGTAAGAARGNTPEGLGRGVIRGGASGLGLGLGSHIGGELGGMTGSPLASILGQLAGGGLGAAGGWMGSGRLLGKPSKPKDETDMSRK
jgi:hypothetical protein